MADNEDTLHERELMARQYKDVYDSGGSSDSAVHNLDSELASSYADANLLARQVYPFNDAQAEIDWILSHERSVA